MSRRMPPVMALAALFAVAFASPAMAQASGQATEQVPAATIEFRDEAEERRFHALLSELRCVMCQNQSLADSNAQIAHDLRREVFGLIRSGRSDRQIKEFLVERYGEFVLYQPPVARHTWLLWFGPALLLLGGAILVLRIVRTRSRDVVATDDTQEW